MPTTLDAIVKDLTALVLSGGATAVKLIDPRDVVVAQWVRNKCQFGCRHFGKRFCCPPYTPVPEETRESLRDYSAGLLVEFKLHRDKLKEDPAYRHMMHKVLFNTERTAFLSGYQKAFAYEAGPCAICDECPAEKLQNPTIFNKKECRLPKEARPSMEACGIDVYSTVHRAGFELQVVRDRSEAFKTYGLVLLE